MRILFFVSLFLLLNSCSSVGNDLKVVDISDLGTDGQQKSLDTGGVPSQQDSRVDGQPYSYVDSQKYIIKVGDKLSIKFFFNPELNEEELIVRPDGHISLQLVQEIRAAGLTPIQLTTLLSKKYMGQLKNPEIAVIVRSVREHFRIYIDGQVGSPGEFEIVGSMSVLQAIALAGGLKQDTAKATEIIVIRRDRGGQPFVIKLDLKAALSGEDLSQDIRLLPNDFVNVPRSFW